MYSHFSRFSRLSGNPAITITIYACGTSNSLYSSQYGMDFNVFSKSINPRTPSVRRDLYLREFALSAGEGSLLGVAVLNVVADGGRMRTRHVTQRTLVVVHWTM